MAISSQTLKEILESFKAQLDDRLDAFAHGLTNSLTHSLTTASHMASMIVFVVFKIH
jgi:hypothetical protein